MCTFKSGLLIFHPPFYHKYRNFQFLRFHNFKSRFVFFFCFVFSLIYLFIFKVADVVNIQNTKFCIWEKENLKRKRSHASKKILSIYEYLNKFLKRELLSNLFFCKANFIFYGELQSYIWPNVYASCVYCLLYFWAITTFL